VGQHSEVFVGLDVAKARHAVAIAEDGRQGEIRFLGEIDADPTSVRRLVGQLAKRHVFRTALYRVPRRQVIAGGDQYSSPPGYPATFKIP
jgi:hypothetical protein